MRASDLYSKRNPSGPFQEHRERPRGTEKPKNHIEGFADKKTLAQWSARATANSYPAGPGKKLNSRDK
jgi:hypothetical protein